jgi:hypothetical protein
VAFARAARAPRHSLSGRVFLLPAFRSPMRQRAA